MFRWIIGSSLKFRVLVVAAAMALLVAGTERLRKMPVDVFPEFAPPIVEVQTEALGLSATDVEVLVTNYIEQLLSGVPWLRSIRSQSVTGLSSVVLTFENGTDVIRARQMVQERLTLAYSLPNVAKPPVMLQPVSSASRFMMIGLTSKKIREMELSVLARWTIKPTLLGVPGVANVAIWGQRLRQLQIHIDTERLRDYRVEQEDIITAAGDALWVTPLTFLRGSAAASGGWIDGPNQRLGIQHIMPIRTPEDMAQIPVVTRQLLLGGKTLDLGQVAEVTDAHPPLIGDALVNNGTGLVLVIEKFPWANTLEVTRGVEAALDTLRPGLSGVEIDASLFRQATYIENSIGNLTIALMTGSILAVLVLGALLFDWRSALISLVAIPISLLTAGVLLYMSGSTLNTMILAGLVVALGIVIDDVVVDVENVMRRLRQRRAEGGGVSIASVISEASSEMRGAVLYAILIVMLAVSPVFFLGGLSGAFFQPFGLVYGLAMIASMAVALTLTPALSLMLFAGAPLDRRESPFMQWLRRGYEAVLARVVQAPRATFAAIGAVVLAGVAVWPLLDQSLLPALKERQVLVRWSTPSGTSHTETYRVTERVNRELQSIPGVAKVAAHVGRAVGGDQVVGINSSQIWVTMDAKADYDKTIAAIRETVHGYPGIAADVNTYLRDRISEVLTGTSEPVVVRIYGAERETLRRKAEDVRRALAGVPGLVDLRTEGFVEEPQVMVKVDLGAAGRAGIKPGDVRRAAATVFSGLEAGFLFEEQKIYDVVVWGAPEKRHSLANIRDLLIERPDMTHVRLGDVVEVSMAATPTLIKHEAIFPYVDVVAGVAGRDVGSVTREVADVLKRIEFPLEYRAEILGEYAERQAVQARGLYIAIAAVIGIFLLLQASFGSWRLASIAFLALPAAVAGGVLAAFAGGGVISLGSLMGFLAILGIAARNAILLIRCYQHLERHEGEAFGLGLVLRGARERLAPIVTSSATIIVVFLPLAMFGQIAGLEVVQPTVVVIMGGLIASTLLTLFVVPLLYLLVGAKGGRQSDLALAS